MKRAEREVKRMKKLKNKYEVPIYTLFWTKDEQNFLVDEYKKVTIKHNVKWNRILFSSLMILALPWSFLHYSVAIFFASFWASYGFSRERRIIDEFEKI